MVKCSEKIIFTAYFLHLFAVNAINRSELFIFTAFSVSLQKNFFSRVRTCYLLHAFNFWFHCANCHLLLQKYLVNLNHNSVNDGKQTRWIIVTNAANFAVNFCKKCGQNISFTAFTAITAFRTKNHRIHRISYKNSPENLDPSMLKNEFKGLNSATAYKKIWICGVSLRRVLAF